MQNNNYPKIGLRKTAIVCLLAVLTFSHHANAGYEEGGTGEVRETPDIKLIESRVFIGKDSIIPFLEQYGCHSLDIQLDMTERVYEDKRGETVYDETWYVVNIKTNDTLMTLINPGGLYLNDDGNILLETTSKSSKRHHLKVRNVCNGRQISYGSLCPDINRVVFMDSNRVCAIDYEENFYILNYSKARMRVEGKCNIYVEGFNEGYVTEADYPQFCYDAESKNLVYQRSDSFLVVQNVETGKILRKAKMDGYVRDMKFLKGNGERKYIAYSYTRKYDYRLNILDYSSLDIIYDMPLNMTYIFEFFSDKYLCAVTPDEESRSLHCYVWDVSKILE